MSSNHSLFDEYDVENVDPCQRIAQQLQSLKQCKYTLTQLSNKMGGDKDSPTIRTDISTIRGKALNLSRTIHLELDSVRNEQERNKSRDVSSQREKTMRMELEEEYGTLLRQIQVLFDEIKSKEAKFPLLTPSSLSSSYSNSGSSSSSSSSSLNSDSRREQPQLQQQQKLEQKNKTFDFDFDEFITVTDQDLDLEELREKEQNEQDLDSLLQVFDDLNVSVMEQEEKVKQVEQNVEKSAEKVHQGTKFQQRAAKFAAVAGVALVGGLVGAAVGGPVGLVVGANIAIGTGLAVGTGVGVGMTVGAAAGLGGKKIVDKVNGANKKLKRTAPTSTESGGSSSIGSDTGPSLDEQPKEESKAILS